MAGSVSGGCVENDVYEHAKQVLAGASPRLLTYGISDEMALSVGLPCGGEIDVFVEEADPALVAEIRGLLDRDQRAVLFTVMEGDAVGSRTLSTDEGDALRRGRSHLLEDERGKVFADVFGPPPRCSSSAPSTRPRSSAAWPGSSAGARSWPTRAAKFATRGARAERRPGDRRLARGGAGAGAARKRHRRRRPHPRRQVRSPRAERRSRDGRALRRRARLPPQPGATPRAAGRGRRVRGRARADRGAVRPRHRRRHARRDRAVDHGRDPRRPSRREGGPLRESTGRIHVEVG